jgi:cytochrome P450
MAVPLTGLFLNIFPDFIKPLAGRIATIPIWWHYYKSGKYVIPEIRRRLENHKRMKEDPEFKYDEPEDFITWHIRIAEQSPHAVNMAAEMIWKRIISVGFVSLHTTVFTATSALLDLAGAPPEHKVFEVIRAEVEQVLAEEGGKWTKAGLGKMVHLDSAIRESMRLSGIISRGPERTVVAKGGVVTPTGIHLPQGAHVGIASYGTRYDNNIYEHGREYDAFRFSRQRQSTDQFATEAAREAVLKNKNLAMVTTGENFVQFGHGQHSCPGRFFAAAQLKIMLSYIVLNYDIKHLDPRPPGEWVGDTMLPPRKATIEIRRRKQLA